MNIVYYIIFFLVAAGVFYLVYLFIRIKRVTRRIKKAFQIIDIQTKPQSTLENLWDNPEFQKLCSDVNNKKEVNKKN